MWIWYNLILSFVAVISLPYFMWTLAKPKRRDTFLHRLAWSADSKKILRSIGRGPKPVWIHALSVGEVISAEPIIHSIIARLPDQKVVFSASTLTGMNMARQLFSGKVDDLFYYPYDIYSSVKLVVDNIQAKVVIIVETDIWPNFQMYLQRKGTPVLLVNARLSMDSYRAYRMLSAFTRNIMAGFTYIGAQTKADAERFIKIGANPDKVVVTGNVKFDQKNVDASISDKAHVANLLGITPQRPVMLMGSTHPGEEALGLGAFKGLKQKFGELVLVVAPRDPGRADGIGRQFRDQGMRVGYISSLTFDKVNDQCDVLVVNTIGILRRLYALADVAFIGGSLVPEGGHNPLEPASFGKPILFGPDMSDFLEISEKLISAGGAAIVRDEAQLQDATYSLLADKVRCRQVGQRALQVFESNSGALEKTMEIILKTIEGKQARWSHL